MDSNSHQNYQHQPNSGLLRYRSAPSSFLVNFTQGLDSGVIKGSTQWENSESDRLASRFVNYSDTASPGLVESENKSLKRMNSQQGYAALPPHYPRQNSAVSSAMDGSYGLVASMGIDQETQSKSFGSNLLRQSSSPAGLFSNISFQNGYAAMKGAGNYGGVNGVNGEFGSSMNKLKSHVSFPSRTHSSLGMLSQISEIESMEPTSPDDGSLGASDGYGPGLSYGSWNDTSHLSENLSGMKRERDNNEKLFSDAQNGELGNGVHMLSHHLSLPKSSAQMAVMDKFLQFPDTVPCKIRAKRGCATHPRSIAERVRRTRISERMRKLQELVPNMDKQTNTADMLDLAVDYIKDLQKQFKSLSEKRAKCKCINLQQKADTDQIV